MQKLKKRKWRFLIFLLLILIFIVYIVFPIAMGWYATWRSPATVGEAPEGFDNLEIIASDGVKLAAWYAPPENGAVIVLLHGAGGSRESIRGYAKMIKDNGFGVLAFDLRGHGESGGSGNRYGWEGTRDVGAALDFLKKQIDVKAVGGLGISVGGEILLGAASTYPEMKAIVSDGATYRSIDDYLILPSRRNLIRSWTTRVMYVSVDLFSGGTPPVRLLDSITEAQNTKFFLIAAGDVDKEIEYNTCFRDAAGQEAELWVAPKVEHIGAYNRYPEEYEEHVISFYHALLLGR